MNIVIFLIGFVAAAVLALIHQMVVAKRAGNAEAEMQKRDDELYMSTQTEFENTAQMISNISSDSITSKTSKGLDRLYNKLKALNEES